MLWSFFAETLDSFLPIRGRASTEVVFWIRLRDGGRVFLIFGIFVHEFPPRAAKYEQARAALDPWAPPHQRHIRNCGGMAIRANRSMAISGWSDSHPCRVMRLPNDRPRESPPAIYRQGG
jgi:hypothetical protein